MSTLKQLRETRNLSQSKLAEAAGINLRILQDYEQGRRDINKAQAIKVYHIAKALNCSMEDLLDT